MKKRAFLKLSAAATASTLPLPAFGLADSGLESMTQAARPIGRTEHLARLDRARELMNRHGIDAIVLEAGSALVYFTGVRWWRSERFTGAVLPADGDIAYVTPHFEEPSVRESLEVGDDVRTWHEQENPFDRVAEVLADRGLKRGRLGIEETVRYFIADGIAAAAPKFEQVSAAPVTRGCRMFKSPAELALMQLANDVTMAAYRHIAPRIRTGMAPADIAAMMNDTTRALGARPTFSLVLLNEASAYPHGTEEPQTVREGGVILMDCGAEVHDYDSDISRTWVHGEPTQKQTKVWDTVRAGQQIAFETARIGTPAGAVDAAVRRFYEQQGYGPGYRTPGLPHRTGHGIGMDVHEPINFVEGEATPLAAGMCLSNEPGIYIYEEFGVRLEDCLYMTDEGPKYFSTPSRSITAPFQ